MNRTRASLVFTLASALLMSSMGLVGCGTPSRTDKSEIQLTRKWARSAHKASNEGFRHLHRFRPLLYRNLVIQGNAVDGLAAHDQKTGNVIWRKFVRNGVEGSGSLSGEDLFVGGSDGNFYSLKAKNGALNWTFPVRVETLGQPLVTEDQVYFLAGNNVLYSLDRKTGDQKWLYSRRDSQSLSVRGGSQPLVYGNLLILGFSDGFLVAFDKNKGQVQWELQLNQNKRFRDVDSDPKISSGRIFVGSFDGSFYSVDGKTGKVNWKTEVSQVGAPLISGKRVFLTSSNNEIIALDKESGKILWRSPLKGLGSSPHLFRSMLVVGESEGALKFLNPVDGTQVASFDPGHGVSSPVGTDEKDGWLYFLSRGGNLFSLEVNFVRPLDLWPWEKQ